MKVYILQKMLPLITAFVVAINGIGGLFGNSAIIPYNPERTDVVLSGTVETDKEKILEIYNSAVKNTGFVIGETSWNFIGTPTVEAESIENAKELMETFLNSYEQTSTPLFEVPGNGILKVSDIKSAKMCEKDGKKMIIINVKDYKHGVNDKNTDNPVTNAYGYATDFSGLLGSMSMKIGNADMSYTDCTISCIVDKNGKIIYGDWDMTGNCKIEDISAKFSDFEIKIDSISFVMETNIDI